ncbi:hypothetical protein [Halosimplex salinum]|uniref:hypothetical protein n=1 Tax=Halosimplex salinum TaxID=1710538 RepID=UPI0019CFCFCA|nr:hypothetical protein [Halosimplex salinum]
MESKGQQQEAVRAAENTGTDPAVILAAGSVVLSWFFFYARGDKQQGLFVGLWPPTILAFASYFKQTQMSDMVERATGSDTLVGRVERMVQSRSQ